jgi:hypothetical protein
LQAGEPTTSGAGELLVASATSLRNIAGIVLDLLLAKAAGFVRS